MCRTSLWFPLGISDKTEPRVVACDALRTQSTLVEMLLMAFYPKYVSSPIAISSFQTTSTSRNYFSSPCIHISFVWLHISEQEMLRCSKTDTNVSSILVSCIISRRLATKLTCFEDSSHSTLLYIKILYGGRCKA